MSKAYAATLQVECWVTNALREFKARDLDLMDVKVGEWSCAFRLGIYLAHQVECESSNTASSSLRVDCEYDRAGNKGDRKPGPGNRMMRPDIVIHRRRRGEVESNLLFLEVKKFRSGNGDKWDLKKVTHAVTNRNGYRYQYGACLSLGVNTTEPRFEPHWDLYEADGQDAVRTGSEELQI